MTGPDAAGLLGEIAGIGREGEGGGYSRHVFDASEMALREWFADRASRAGLRVEADGNANLWAWCGAPGDGAVLTGSHLDSVPGGGAFDGPLGVASALEVVARWRRRGHVPAVPFAVVVFAEEEGGRFGLPCAGSRLAAGTVAPSEVLTRRDRDGVTFAEAARRAGFDPALCGPVPRLTHAAAFVEVHIEQGRALADLDRPVAIARSIAAHGRWRVEFTGEANHAGTTRMADRADPVVALAALIQAARAHATRLDARATVGRVAVAPGGTNVIASTARGWLDARAGDSAAVHRLVEAITAAAREAATAEGTRVEIVAESFSPEVFFDSALAARMEAVLPGAPHLDTGAGHDAGALAGIVPSGMLFVRNPTGASHTPAEYCGEPDIAAGVDALDAVLTELTR